MQTTLTSKGQVVIPGPVRKQLHLGQGTRFEVSVHDSNIVLQVVQPKAVAPGRWTPQNPAKQALTTEELCQPVVLTASSKD